MAWRLLHNEEVRDLYSSCRNIRAMKSDDTMGLTCRSGEANKRDLQNFHGKRPFV